jgi:hypothetical protein
VVTTALLTRGAGDRKHRRMVEDEIMSCCYVHGTIAGSLLLTGCVSGTVHAYDASSLSCVRIARVLRAAANLRVALRGVCGEREFGEQERCVWFCATTYSASMFVVRVCRDVKTVRTDGSSLESDASRSSIVTAVSVPTYDTGFAGHADGTVRAFRLLGSGVCATLAIPGSSSGSGSPSAGTRAISPARVVALLGRHRADEGDWATELMVVLSDGWVHRFSTQADSMFALLGSLRVDVGALSASSTPPSVEVPAGSPTRREHSSGALTPSAPAHVSGAVYCRAQDAVIMFVTGLSKLAVLDFAGGVEGGTCALLHPLDGSGRRGHAASTLQLGCTQDGGRLFASMADGTVFVRELVRARGETGPLGLKPFRRFDPATEAEAVPAHAIYHDAPSDNLIAGGADGYVRILRMTTRN